jgi:hypothetical protein
VTPVRALAFLAAALLSGCIFDFKNPAEGLRAGQVGGTVLADVAGGGTPVAREGVAVSLKGATFDQATRPNGRFVVLDLPAGRHRLLFRNGATWALERDVDIAYGSDGQPEGIELGDVVLHYSAAVEGSISLPLGNSIVRGVAVDESSGLTAPLVVGTASGGNPVPPVTFRFPMLAIGTHLIKLSAVDGNLVPGSWVGGQVVVEVTLANQGTTVSLANVQARAATLTGRLRFKVQAIGLALSPTQVVVNLTPDPLGLNPIHPASDGSVDVTVPEGLYAIQLVPPISAPPLPGLAPTGPPPLASSAPLAAAPVATVGPPLVYAVVLQGRVAEVGSVYVASDTSVAASLSACSASADCGGTSCSAGRCVGYVPKLPPVTAATTFCAGCLYAGLDSQTGLPPTCQAGPGVQGVCACPGPGAGVDCAARGPLALPVPSSCVPAACGFTCTLDGTSLATFKPATGACP